MSNYFIIGLGNPGKKYELTRHNVGFMVVDALAEKLGAPKFVFKKLMNALVSKVTLNETSAEPCTLLIAKPQTFMNLSGNAVAALLKKAKNQEIKKSVLVISDDLDLPLGSFRLREKGSAGGHNGLISIIQTLDTEEFPRIKIGIRPPALARQPGKAEEFVLKKFTTQELKQMKEEIIPLTIEQIVDRVNSKSQIQNHK